MLKDNFNLAYKNIRERMSRSILTLLGIAIGIMAIISLMGLGEGMNQAVTGELSSLSDTIIVNVGQGLDIGSIFSGGGLDETNGEYLTERDISDVTRIQGIKKVSTQLSGGGILRYNSLDVAALLTGMDVNVMHISYGIEDLESGSLLEIGDQNKCLIGYSVAHEYFDSDIAVGSRIKINGEKNVVNGIFSQYGTGGIGSTDDLVLLTSRDFKKITGQSNITSATVQVYDITNVESIADEIEQVINENHGEDDFVSATTMSSILESIQNIIGIMQMMLVAIASIALVVASIGIMNTMLTSVMERTREIGIMKAIGATNKDVMLIFIIEGMLVSIVGGIFGVLLGVFGSQGITGLLTAGPMAGGGGMSLTPIISIGSIGLAVGVSLVVGVLSSLYPAWKAARMSPIEAVRYE
jgi:putative ABC transport system permease protein